MRPNLWSFAVLAVLVVATATVLGWQHRTTGELSAEIARQRTQAQELARLQTENRRLLVAQPTAEELAELLANQVAAEQLQARLAAMRRREEELARAAAAEAAAPPVPSLKGNSVGFNLWRNVGQATPDAAFETVLWAAASGDIDALADLLLFDAESRNRAAEAFARLPAAVQNEMGTPERLMALLTAMDVPLGRASILRQFSTPAGTKVSAQLIDAEGKAKVALFTLQSEADRWRLVVPAEVVKKYAGWLHAPTGKSTGAK